MRGKDACAHQVLEGLDVSKDGSSAAGKRTMSATEFRAKCLGLMDEVAETGREIVITKRGETGGAAKCRIRPVTGSHCSVGIRDIRFKIHGDIGAPIDVEWDAETGKNWDEPLVLSRVQRPDSVDNRQPDRRGGRQWRGWTCRLMGRR